MLPDCSCRKDYVAIGIVGWLSILLVSTIVALVLVLKPNVRVGEVRPSNAVTIALAAFGGFVSLVIFGELFMRWLISGAIR
jgi:hypothetical protein